MRQNGQNFYRENERLLKFIESTAIDIEKFCAKKMLGVDARYFLASAWGAKSMSKRQLTIKTGKSGLYLLHIDHVRKETIENIYYCNLAYMLAFNLIESQNPELKNLMDSYNQLTKLDIESTSALQLNKGEGKFNLAENAKHLHMDLDSIAYNHSGVLLIDFDCLTCLKRGIEKREEFLGNRLGSYQVFIS